MKKRILAVLLATVLLLSNFCVIYAEEQSFKEDIYTYILNGGNAVITAVDDVDGEVIVPEKLGGYDWSTPHNRRIIRNFVANFVTCAK